MADHKVQHFVPRCLLKPFTLNGEGKALNLLVWSKDRLIEKAPVKSQCARDYLYGEDGQVELELAKIEGDYSNCLRRVVEKKETEDDLLSLRFFAYLQLRRTEMAMKHLRASEEGLFQEVFGRDEPERPPARYYILQSLKLCFGSATYIEDLKIRIVENRTRREFVACDDPAVCTNRFTTQRLYKSGFGVSSSGLILVLPLTPRLALICYDNQVYTAPNCDAGRIIVTKDSDVEALNELQYLKAGTSIYFASWDTREYVRENFRAAAPRRLEKLVAFHHLVLAEERNGERIYRSASKEEAKAAKSSVIHQESLYPTPSAWLSQLKYRTKMRTFSNGNGAGHVRKVEWLNQ
jgi:hypothetical protein